MQPWTAPQEAAGDQRRHLTGALVSDGGLEVANQPEVRGDREMYKDREAYLQRPRVTFDANTYWIPVSLSPGESRSDDNAFPFWWHDKADPRQWRGPEYLHDRDGTFNGVRCQPEVDPCP